MRTRSKWVSVLVGGALLVGLPSVAQGQTSGKPMTTAQAQRVFIKAVCPLNRSLAALEAAESAPDPKWSEVQALLRRSADMQMRAANRLGHPKRPWPRNVRHRMSALVEVDLALAGSNYVFASATSLAEYKALSKSRSDDLSPRLESQLKAFLAARPIIHKRLGLPKNVSCRSD